MVQGYAGIPPGPLSAYLGVRQANEEQGLQKFGLLQKMQEAQEARKLREALAAQGDVRQRELAAMSDERAREFNASRLKQQQNMLTMQDQWKQMQFGQMKDETARRLAADAWQKEYQTQQLAIQKQIADLKAATTVRGKPIPIPLQKQLSEGAELADATQRFATSFKDEFGGKTITGGLGNVAGKLMGDPTGQTQWWQDYELHQSQIRNKLFGSALTASEIEAWNKSAINPRMESGEIRKNLARRNDIETKALYRLMKGAEAGGYNKEQIEAFTGRSPPAQMIPAAGPKEGDKQTSRSGRPMIFRNNRWEYE